MFTASHDLYHLEGRLSVIVVLEFESQDFERDIEIYSSVAKQENFSLLWWLQAT